MGRPDGRDAHERSTVKKVKQKPEKEKGRSSGAERERERSLQHPISSTFFSSYLNSKTSKMTGTPAGGWDIVIGCLFNDAHEQTKKEEEASMNLKNAAARPLHPPNTVTLLGKKESRGSRHLESVGGETEQNEIESR